MAEKGSVWSAGNGGRCKAEDAGLTTDFMCDEKLIGEETGTKFFPGKEKKEEKGKKNSPSRDIIFPKRPKNPGFYGSDQVLRVGMSVRTREMMLDRCRRCRRREAVRNEWVKVLGYLRSWPVMGDPFSMIMWCYYIVSMFFFLSKKVNGHHCCCCRSL